MAPDDFPNFQTEPSKDASENLKLKVAMADYDRIRPLIDGRVRAEGIDLDITTDDIREFCIGPVYETGTLAALTAHRKAACSH
jgi:hypothetical protein